jgi:hypothetical protein
MHLSQLPERLLYMAQKHRDAGATVGDLLGTGSKVETQAALANQGKPNRSIESHYKLQARAFRNSDAMSFSMQLGITRSIATLSCRRPATRLR